MKIYDLNGNLVPSIGSPVPEPPTSNSLQDILHKDSNYTYNKATDALESISDAIDEQHLHVHILFIIPEAVVSITADNTVLYTELCKLGDVEIITQADALEFPAFGGYAIAVMGTENGAASWTTSNLADLKNILGLTLVCVDNVSAEYFQIGTGGTAATKTVIKAISEIEGTKMGLGETAGHYPATGLDAGDNTVTSSATYHTLDMSDGNITETVFCTENVDPDGGSANTDVTMGIIRWIQHDGTIGVDEDGNDIPATLAFAGFAYEGAKLTTLGKATFYLFCHMLVQLRIQEATVEAGGLVADLRKRIFGNMVNNFGTTTPLVEWIAGQNSVGSKLPVGTSLVDLIDTIDGIVDTLLTRITAAVATASALTTHNNALTAAKAVIDAIKSIVDTPANFMADVSSITTSGPTETQMNTAHALLATEAKQDTMDTNVDQIEVLVAEKVMGREQSVATTIDLNQAASTYDLFTGTTQVVILESLNIKMPTGDAGGSLTSISIWTDDFTAGVIISSTTGAVANLTSEANLGWVGTLYITVGTKIRLTIAGGAHGSAYVCNVTAKCSAVVSGGYLA